MIAGVRFEGVVVSLYDELLEVLKAAGCERMSGGKGSHQKWRNPANGRVTTVPRSKSRHTANAVLKQLGIDARL